LRARSPALSGYRTSLSEYRTRLTPRRRVVSFAAVKRDAVLIGFLALFAFTSLVMEPYFVFGVDYHRAGDPFAAAWLFYSRWDPAFLDRPLFLRIICGIDLFVFGPFYLVLIYALIKRREWIRVPALMYVAAIVYSTVLYFTWELIDARANLTFVFLINIPYTLVPIWLGVRLSRSVAPSVDKLYA
jgi:EXPERA (EXPanded EBP superfamily)